MQSNVATTGHFHLHHDIALSLFVLRILILFYIIIDFVAIFPSTIFSKEPIFTSHTNMMYFAGIVFVCFFRITLAHQNAGFCSQVYKMHLSCISHDQATVEDNPTGMNHQMRRGKAGPRGPPGIVNYENINATIGRYFQDYSRKMMAKLNELDSKFTSQIAEAKLECSNEMREKLTELESNFTSQITAIKPDSIRRGGTQSHSGFPTDCSEVSRENVKILNETGGVFDIYPTSRGPVEVYCDLDTDGGGWTVIQRRGVQILARFNRTWHEYVDGFGDKDKDFWLGLETIYQLTKSEDYELRVDLEDFGGDSAYAKYSTFYLESVGDNYRLIVKGYSGTAGHSLPYSNNTRFSTIDSDNDNSISGNCAEKHGGGGGWWFSSCSISNLNGIYYNGERDAMDGIYWYKWRDRNRSLKSSEMKIRKKN